MTELLDGVHWSSNKRSSDFSFKFQLPFSPPDPYQEAEIGWILTGPLLWAYRVAHQLQSDEWHSAYRQSEMETLRY